MEYYYMDQDEVNIRTKIKNLVSISSTVLNSTGKIVLSCYTADGVSLVFDNSHKHFDLFISVLSRVYEEEKNNRNIMILNDETREFLEHGAINRKTSEFLEHAKPVNSAIEFQKYDITSLANIIYQVISITFGIEGIEILDISTIHGIRYHFNILVTTNTGTHIIPIKFNKVDDYEYSLDLGNMYGFKSISLKINFNINELLITWTSRGLPIYGKIRYNLEDENDTISLKDEIKETIEVIFNDSIIYTNEEIIKSTSSDDVSQVFELSNDMKIMKRVVGDTVEVNYISDNKLMLKNRKIVADQVYLAGLPWLAASSKHVIEEYKIEDDLSLIQEFYVDIPYGNDYYRNKLMNHVLFKVIAKKLIYYPEKQSELAVLKSLDNENIKLLLEGNK